MLATPSEGNQEEGDNEGLAMLFEDSSRVTDMSNPRDDLKDDRQSDMSGQAQRRQEKSDSARYDANDTGVLSFEIINESKLASKDVSEGYTHSKSVWERFLDEDETYMESDQNAISFRDNAKQSDEAAGLEEAQRADGERSEANRHYKPRWGSSSESFKASDTDDDAAKEEPFGDDDLPIIADEANKALHKETKRLEKERDEAEKSAKEHDDRVAIMAQHLQNIRQEIDYTNGLMAAKNKEIETEEHLTALAERESGMSRLDIKRIEDSIGSERERFKSTQTQILKAREEMETLKAALNWNQEELEQWAEASKKKEEDNLALQKYTRADEKKINELTLSIEHLTKLSAEKQVQIENETTETHTRQVELEKTAESFKSQHVERRELVKQWQDTVEAMRSRDKEISEISIRYAEAKRVRDDQLKLLAKNREVLALIDGDIDGLKQELDAAERLVQNKRLERISQQQALQSLLDELEVLKHESAASAANVQRLQSHHRAVEAEYTSKEAQLVSFKNRCDNIKKRLDEEKKVTLSHEKATIQLEQFLVDREIELKQADVVLQSLKDQLFADSQHLAKLRQEEADLSAEIKDVQANHKNLSAKLKDLEGKRSRQKEIVYNADFQLQQVERKIARGLGERSDEEKKQLQARILELENDLVHQRQTRKSLSQQCKKVQLELHLWKRRKNTSEQQYRKVRGQISELELEISSCETSLKQLLSSKEEAMISHDFIRLEVRRLRDALRSRAERVIALEERREQLFLAMAERKDEIKVHAEVQAAQLRVAEEDRRKNAVELGRRGVALEKIKSKYETLIKVRPSDSGDGEEHSQIYFRIMAAQKREELQQEGDKLDATIRNKEREMRAMEKTLSHLREENTRFRLSFHKADMDSDAAKELKALEEKVRSSEKVLFDRKKELRFLEHEFEGSERQLKKVRQKTSQPEAENEHMKDACRQNIEKSRLQGSVMSTNDLLSVSPISEELKSMKEIQSKADAINNIFARILGMLSDLGREFPELEIDIVNDLASRGIEVS